MSIFLFMQDSTARNLEFYTHNKKLREAPL